MSSPSTHALLSPSSSHRWLECTPSALLESYEPSVSSVFAEEGTEAHALAELKLSHILKQISDKEFETRFNDFVLNSKFYNSEFEEFVDSYCNEIMTIVNEDYKGIDVKVALEERVVFDDIVPNGAGTSDAIIIGPDFIHIVDLKFGKGVPVSAVNNPQLRLYALGAVRKYIRECICNEVRMTIVQPRLYNCSTDYISINALNDWAINYVKPRAEKASKGEGDFVAGDHCKFCKLKGKCKKLADEQLAIAQAEFGDVIVENNKMQPQDLTPEIIAKVLDIGPKFIDWFKDVEKFAIKSSIENDLKIPGYKLVEGRSTRILTNQENVIETLRTSGFSEDDYLSPRKLLGISVLEKNIGKKLFNNLCSNYIVKPQGKPTIVKEDDKRPPLDSKNFKLIGDEFFEDNIEE